MYQIIYSLFQIIVDFLKPYVRANDNYSLLFCKLFYSQYSSAVFLTVSSYNLALYAVECMISVIMPILHKTKVSRRLQCRVAKWLWVVCAVWNLPFVLALNGQWPSGVCRFWNTPSSIQGTGKSVLIATYTGSMYVLPLTVMCVSYASISIRLSTRYRKNKEQNRIPAINTIKTVTRVILAYTCCVMPPTIMFIVKVGGL